MRQFFSDYLERLRRLHEDAKATIQGLDDDTLARRLGPDMNPLSVLVVHTTGAERFWAGDVAMQDPSNRDREGEFQVSGLSVAELVERLDSSLSYIERALEKLALEDLEQVRKTPEKREVTVGWCLMHVLAHTATHLGHMQITRQALKVEG